VASLEGERDEWEKRFEEMTAKHSEARNELDEISAQMESL